MLVSTGVLCVPAYDEAAVDAIRRVLAHHAAAAPPPQAGGYPNRFVIVQERHASMQRNLIEELFYNWCDIEELDFIVTIGGTQPAPGPSSQETVPEATLAMGERPLPGLAEAMRRAAAAVTPLALLDRSQAVIRGRTLILNLPAGPQAAALFLDAVGPVLLPLLGLLQEQPTALDLNQVILAAQGAGAGAVKETGTAQPQAQQPAPQRGKQALDPAEFEAFLKRRSPPESP